MPHKFRLLGEEPDLEVAVAIDGFGAAYSSLVGLRVLPVSKLKIDRTLVAEVHREGKAIIAGIVVGIPLSKVPLTAVPQRTAISHAFGGLAAGLVGTAKFILWSVYEPEELSQFRMAAIVAW